MSKNKLVVLSADAMVYEDIEYLLDKPNFRRLYYGGSTVKKCRTIYPSVTYPCHVTMSTGTYPEKHGVVNNTEFMPGTLKNVPWTWFSDIIKTPDIFAAAKSGGYSTAAVFWPVTGNNKNIDYLVDEYWPQSENDTKEACFKRSGTSDDIWESCVKPYVENVKIRTHPATDHFNIECACAIIRKYKPDVLFIHPGNIDHYRHATGIFSSKVNLGLDETDEFLGMLFDAAKDAGVYDETNFFLVSDHGQMDIVRSVKPNVIFADNGLITINSDGSLADWQAYTHSCGMSAQVHLKNPSDRAIWEKTYSLLKSMRDEGIYGIGDVYTTKEVKEKEHLDGSFSFVLETDGYTSFSEGWTRPIIQNLDLSDYRYGRATHGYLPDKGPQPTLIACGPAIKQGVEIERRPTVDEAPTYAKILGVEMPWADGTAITEILK